MHHRMPLHPHPSTTMPRTAPPGPNDRRASSTRLNGAAGSDEALLWRASNWRALTS